eukprot:PhM_4_TR4493/c0_g1_i1/m.62043
MSILDRMNRLQQGFDDNTAAAPSAPTPSSTSVNNSNVAGGSRAGSAPGGGGSSTLLRGGHAQQPRGTVYGAAAGGDGSDYTEDDEDAVTLETDHNASSARGGLGGRGEGVLITWGLKPFLVGVSLSLGMSVGYGIFDLIFGRRRRN